LGNLFLLLCVPLLWAIVIYSHRFVGDFNFAVFFVLGLAFFIFGTWIWWALAVKRLHDRDKSAVWLLLFYGVPLLSEWVVGAFKGSGAAYRDDVSHFGVYFKFLTPNLNLNLTDNALLILSAGITTWTFIELGLRRGIASGNLYGEDPLQR
jgi:uncharacterized membrane protein YhaH (DUF805 family)